MQNLKLNAVQRQDYDATVKVGKRRIKSYSPRQMKRLYENGEFNIVGETLSGKEKNKIALLSVFLNDENPVAVSPYKTYSHVFYKVVGYVCVDGEKDKYVAVLRVRFLLWLLLLIALIAMTVATVYYLKPDDVEDEPTWKGEYIVPEAEPDAEVFDNGGKDKAQSEEGGGTVAMTYKRLVTADLGNHQLKFFFANPYYSNHDVSLEVIITSEGKDNVIAKSGLIKPGYSLEKLTLKENIELIKGKYKAYFNVIYYDPVTGEKALVRANIPVTIAAE